nr:hypothetical protein [Abalone asfa-like virus]
MEEIHPHTVTYPALTNVLDSGIFERQEVNFDGSLVEIGGIFLNDLSVCFPGFCKTLEEFVPAFNKLLLNQFGNVQLVEDLPGSNVYTFQNKTDQLVRINIPDRLSQIYLFNLIGPALEKIELQPNAKSLPIHFTPDLGFTHFKFRFWSGHTFIGELVVPAGYNPNGEILYDDGPFSELKFPKSETTNAVATGFCSGILEWVKIDFLEHPFVTLFYKKNCRYSEKTIPIQSFH